MEMKKIWKRGKIEIMGNKRRGVGERISGKSVKIIKDIIFFVFAFQFLFHEKNIY